MSVRQSPATETQRLKRGPAWLAETPLILSGNHDSIPVFMRRRGGGMVGAVKEQYEQSHSEEFARRIKAAGITLWITYYYKGFGVEVEKEYMEVTRNFVPILKKYGLKVGVYIGSTMAYETFPGRATRRRGLDCAGLSGQARLLRRPGVPETSLLHAPGLRGVHEAHCTQRGG